MLVMFTHTTLDMLQKATSIKHDSGLILEKQRCQHWQKLPHDIKELNLFIFSRKAKLNIELIRLKWVHYKQSAA